MLIRELLIHLIIVNVLTNIMLFFNCPNFMYWNNMWIIIFFLFRRFYIQSSFSTFY
ncbi:hypothetical protein C2G38_2099707 [Gigaspora rosea]|uniref:Uncharacterized protein n=1 Tax=Gigaspora rosea TaxID=44941 RepID=A0A397UZA5_9GLOM|nr:hypothetical protein C2G38_2099707 [Gigaspora rosea]